MAVKTYSLKTDGNKKLSANFSVKEFACKDGTDKILIDDQLVTKLQQIRDYFNQPIIINSAYRTESHNKKVGGSPSSQHLRGTAADIVIRGVAPLLIAQYAEYLGFNGIGWYSGFTHIDVRQNKSRWDQRTGAAKAIATFGGQDQFSPLGQYAAKVQKRFGFDDNTMAYLKQYKYAGPLLEKLAEKA